MEATDALIKFLSHAISERWRHRYVSLVQTKRGRKTFTSDLCHNLGGRLEPSKMVVALPPDAWSAPAYLFKHGHIWGQEETSVKTAFDLAGDSSLIIDRNGAYGIYRPEDMIDDMRFIAPDASRDSGAKSPLF